MRCALGAWRRGAFPPAVVDYGATNGGVVAYYGSDDGVFHAVRGNQGATDGTELWSFIAPEHWTH